MAEEGKYIDQVTVVHIVPEYLMGGNPSEKQFQIFAKSVLEAYIKSLIAQRPNGITLTGLTGRTIIHESFVGRELLSMMIDDEPRNTNFTKGNDNHIESDQVLLTDPEEEFELKERMKVTFYFK